MADKPILKSAPGRRNAAVFTAVASAGHFSLALNRDACQRVENRLQPIDGPEGPVLLCLLRRPERAP
jgi:hypothetical protein